MSDTAWEALSQQAVSAAGVVYLLALLSYLVEWSSLRHVPVATERRASRRAGLPAVVPPTPFEFRAPSPYIERVAFARLWR